MNMATLKKLLEYDTKSIYPHKKALSSSQFLLYEKSPAEFYVKYELGAKQENSLPMMIGSIFSAAYADRSFPFVEHLTALGCTVSFVETFGKALAKLPVVKGGVPETPIWAKYDGWKFRATLDDWVEERGIDIENKTGQKPWTVTRVNESDQITFQAWAVWKTYGRPPHKIILNWWNTRIKSYADVRTFETSRTVSECMAFEKRVAVVIENLNAKNFTNSFR